jgi:hypothetical protein
MAVLREQQLADDIQECGDSSDRLRQELIADISREIHRLQRFSARGVLALALFLAVSLLAWWGFPFLPAPETVTVLLGKPPSARIISIALLIYTFSALILSLARMSTGLEHRSSFSHVVFLTSFFLFYYFSRSLQENYWAVFGSGITILGVESYRIWSFCSETISKKQEDHAYVVRTGRRPPQTPL